MILLVMVPTIMAVVFQWWLGGSFWSVFEVAVIAAAGLSCFVLLGAYNSGAWLVLLYALGSVVIALWAKSLLGQSMNSHLYDPSTSFPIMLVSMLALLCAVVVIKLIPVGRPIFRSPLSVVKLSWLSWISFLLGVGFWFANHFLQNLEGTGFGGFAALRDLMFMGVVARTAMLLEATHDVRSWDIRLILMIGIAVLLGMMSDSKTWAALPVVAYFVTTVFYRGGLSRNHAIVMVAGVLVFALVLAPLIHAWRRLGAQELPLVERLTIIERSLTNSLENGELSKYVSLAKLNTNGGYYNYFGNSYRSRMLLGRFATVQQVDPVVPRVKQMGAMEMSAIVPALTCLMPRFLYPDKPACLVPYNILVHYHVIVPPAGDQPTLPLAGQAYAAFGMAGVFWICLPTFLAILLAYKKLGWDLYRNVYAIFFFVDFVVVYSAQGNLSQYAGATVRYFPMYAVVFMVVIWIGRLRASPNAPLNAPEITEYQQ